MRANGNAKTNSIEAHPHPHRVKARLTRDGLDLDVESVSSRMIFAIAALLIAAGCGVIVGVTYMVITILS